jgi:hypothetical protein
MKTHCKRGHEKTPKTYVKNNKGYSYCRICLNEGQRKRYHNDEALRNRKNEQVRAWRKRTYIPKFKKRVVNIRERLLAVRTQCMECGETHPGCLDFHHRNPAEKKFQLVASQMGNRSWTSIEAEIAKCDVLCSNCHRKLHWEMRQKEQN